MKTWQILYLDMTGHLHPGRRCRGLESPASHRSSCHGAGCQGMDMSCLKLRFSFANLFLFWEGCKKNLSPLWSFDSPLLGEGGEGRQKGVPLQKVPSWKEE